MTAQVQVEGLSDLARELKRIDPQLNKQLRLVNKTVSQKVVDAGRPAIAGLRSPGGRIAVPGLTARATPTQATVVLAGRNRTIRANVFGTLSHVAWGHKKPGRGPWQPWQGRSWQPEELYGFGPALTRWSTGMQSVNMRTPTWMR